VLFLVSAVWITLHLRNEPAAPARRKAWSNTSGAGSKLLIEPSSRLLRAIATGSPRRFIQVSTAEFCTVAITDPPEPWVRWAAGDSEGRYKLQQRGSGLILDCSTRLESDDSPGRPGAIH
jgi:hypothetical protein